MKPPASCKRVWWTNSARRQATPLLDQDQHSSTIPSRCQTSGLVICDPTELSARGWDILKKGTPCLPNEFIATNAIVSPKKVSLRMFHLWWPLHVTNVTHVSSRSLKIEIFLPFCHNARVWQTDRRTNQTVGQTDRQTDRQLSRS